MDLAKERTDIEAALVTARRNVEAWTRQAIALEGQLVLLDRLTASNGAGPDVREE